VKNEEKRGCGIVSPGARAQRGAPTRPRKNVRMEKEGEQAGARPWRRSGYQASVGMAQPPACCFSPTPSYHVCSHRRAPCGPPCCGDACVQLVGAPARALHRRGRHGARAPPHRSRLLSVVQTFARAIASPDKVVLVDFYAECVHALPHGEG
jgi:hypothetical protein